MKPKLTYFHTSSCPKCQDLKPFVKELEQLFEISYVNTHENELITEQNDIMWVPAFVLEDSTGKHKFEGATEIKEFLQKIIL
jgi:thiol-disulfide isomerase/thioredoxin